MRSALVHLIHEFFVTSFRASAHQPLHCGRDSDRKGTSIDVTYMNYFNEATFWQRTFCGILPSFLRWIANCDMSLHGTWDYGIISKAIREDFNGNREDLEDSIWYEYIEGNGNETESWLSCLPDAKEYPYLTEQILQDCVLEWANESLEMALKVSYVNTDGSGIVSGTDLTEEYHQIAFPVVRRQLAMGGVRLAALLERSLNPYEEAPSSAPTSSVAPSAVPSEFPSDFPSEA